MPYMFPSELFVFLTDEIALILLIYREEKVNEETKPMLCDPCLCGNIQTTASRFCQTCEDPEPMCEACAQLHTRQKATKGHEISSDMKQFHQHEGLSNQTYVQ